MSDAIHPEDSSTSPAPSGGSFLHRSDAGSSTHGSRSHSRSLRRSETTPEPGEGKMKPFKRIIVLCDGTWEDGVTDKRRSEYTNVMRLARSIHHEDSRPVADGEPPIMQVVFYQSGIGSEKNLYSEYYEGTTGCSLPDKVEEAYAFIAHNFKPGDEIYIFGFSRGAYTARMIAMFIGEIGVLSREKMDQFASIFLDFKKLGLCKDGDTEERAILEARLKDVRRPEAEGRIRAAYGKDKFTVKCVGVWDTVGSLGLPDEIQLLPRQRQLLFGFPDSTLGEHIEAAYQALAINEMRRDFDCNKFVQTKSGKEKGQVLKQTWFSGCHADIGGGYKAHDLSDLSLIWMVANIEPSLHIDVDYIRKALKPVAPWGEQLPHDSRTGIFFLTEKIQRTLPTAPNPATQETVHSSVLSQMKRNDTKALEGLFKRIEEHPSLMETLMPLEDQFRETWPYDPSSSRPQEYASRCKAALSAQAAASSLSPVGQSWFSSLVRSISFSSRSSFSSGSRSSRSISATSVSTQPTDIEGLDISPTVEVKRKSVTVTSSRSFFAGNKKKRESRVEAVQDSLTVVVHSPT